MWRLKTKHHNLPILRMTPRITAALQHARFCQKYLHLAFVKPTKTTYISKMLTKPLTYLMFANLSTKWTGEHLDKMPKTLATGFPSLAGSGWRTSGLPSAAHDSFFFIEGLLYVFFFLNGCVQIFYSGPVQQGFLDFLRFSDLKV